MRNLIFIIPLLTLGCVSAATPAEYAAKAHPECRHHRTTAHQLASVSNSEVYMECDGVATTIAVKCQFGWGILADTVCHENN